MKANQRNGLIFLGVAVAAGGYLYYRSKKNEAEGNALLTAINKSYTQNDISKAGDEAIKNIQSSKLDFNKMKIGNLYGSLNDPKIGPALKSAISKTAADLWASMKGTGTDVPAFMKAFQQIKNKNTMNWIDQIFKSSVGKGTGLFEWMKDETALNNSSYGFFSDKTKGVLDTIPFINSYWNPAISQYLQKLPEY